VKKKVLVDICVVATAKYYVKDKDYRIAKEFIEKAEAGEFELYSAHILHTLIKKWRKKEIRNGILKFYSTYCYTIPPAEIERKIKEKKLNLEFVLSRLEENGIKREDGILAIIASLFNLTLVTLNRKHLRNNEKLINKILKEVGLDEIKILLPNEI
jgi:predicted nucleic acid-binding protein